MTPRQRAELALEGLSVGDAFGERFFRPAQQFTQRVAARQVPEDRRWPITDDTIMARAIVRALIERSGFDADATARAFLEAYAVEPWRGYGSGMHDYFQAQAYGVPWRQAARDLFDGSGSYGNGAAMRVAPLGAWYADALGDVVRHATAQSEITHAHPEAAAGAIAVAVAAAVAWQTRDASLDEARALMAQEVLDRTPESRVRERIAQAFSRFDDATTAQTARALGNGSRVTAQDTVPFVIWSATRHLDDFTEALWQTVSAGGDRDTTCAMVGGIVALRLGLDAIPETWRAAREPLT